MTKFDKEIKKLSKEFQVPETYDKKVDQILETIEDDCVSPPHKKPFVKIAIAVAALCVLLTGYLCFSRVEVAEASFLETFKQTIMDFFGMGEEEMENAGVESERQEAVSKPDLMMELKEVVMDSQNIYAVIKITAPPSVEFKQDMTFDYFGFCEGTNYNDSGLVPGVRDCKLLEVLHGRPNVGTFVVSIGTDEQIAEGEDVTVFFQNLLAGPYEDKPEILVEGMWSLSFTASYTSSKEIAIKGTEDMEYSFAGTTARIKKIKLLPLGMTLVSDVSKVDTDTLNTTDTRFAIRLKMLDGSEVNVNSPDLKEKGLSDGGSISVYEKKGRTYQKYVGQFRKAIDISQVVGLYVSDYYVPVKNYD